MDSLISLGLCDKDSNFRSLTNSSIYEPRIFWIIRDFIIAKPTGHTKQTYTRLIGIDHILILPTASSVLFIEQYEPAKPQPDGKKEEKNYIPHRYDRLVGYGNYLYIIDYRGKQISRYRNLGAWKTMKVPDLGDFPVYLVKLEAKHCLSVLVKRHGQLFYYTEWDKEELGFITILSRYHTDSFACNSHADKQNPSRFVGRIRNDRTHLTTREWFPPRGKVTYWNVPEENIVPVSDNAIYAWDKGKKEYSVYTKV